jgi:hypothetical protein
VFATAGSGVLPVFFLFLAAFSILFSILRMQRFLISCALAALAVFGFSACSSESGCTDPAAINYNPDAEKSAGRCSYPVSIDQTLYSLSPLPGGEIGLTGQTFGETTVTHDGAGSLTPDQTIRDIFCNVGNTAPIRPGDFVVKKTYAKTPSGGRGILLGITTMIKQPEGYFPQGGDWEYLSMTTVGVDSLNPNGVLSQATVRGKLVDCATCHAKAGGANFLFFR